jgi:hypothetical protein
MSETETPVVNPPYVVPFGYADAPPPVPPEPTLDAETQAWIDAHVASPDPRDPDQDPAMPPETYHAGFAKPPDPRDPTESLLTPGELFPPAPNLPPPDAAPTAPPVNIDAPYVEQVGATLTCTMGNWEGEPTQYAYLWVCDGLEVGTGTDVYVLVADDVGRAYACVVTATNAAGSTEAPASNAVTVVEVS